ncbi:uncharacterized protein LOC126674851 [Mercurialis annua]|uniref:uncharacterized protein LOC126674851 n=1 Tax=Mercurialis annua TaxID=3986 RepID=UPI00215EFE34|nr:uncharacterized protein LOC126674851 [Mercurialis annua]
MVLPYGLGGLGKLLKYVDVIGDGNCGFRVVADYVYGDHNMSGLTRRNIANKLACNRDLYKRLSTDGIDQTIARIRWERGSCTSGHWIQVANDLFLIATLLNTAIILLQGGTSSKSRRGSYTVFPLHASELDTRRLIEMVTLNLGSYSHFIRLNLASNFPVPPIVTMWFRDMDHNVASCDRLYDNRREQWDRLSAASV